MNEKISKIKLELLKEEFTKQIKDGYILNLSMVLLDEFENLKIENNQLKENYERTYNENRALRQKQYITDTDLIYENYILSRAINKAIEYIESNSLCEEEYDYDYEENSYLSGIDDETAKKDLLKILREEDLLKILKGEANE